jgi:hypothetical protein
LRFVATTGHDLLTEADFRLKAEGDAVVLPREKYIKDLKSNTFN